MKIFLYLGLGLVVCFLAVAPAAAQIQPTISYEYYTVPYIEGVSVQKMVSVATPLRMDNGRTASGVTRWTIASKNPVASSPSIGVCRLEQANVSCDCLIVLPKLEGGDAQAKNDFAKYFEKTKNHELEHCRLATEYANIMSDAFMAIKDQKCEDIGKAMIAIHEKTASDCQTAQSRFDYKEYGYNHYLMAETLGQILDSGIKLRVAPAPTGRPATKAATQSQAAAPPQTAKPSGNHITTIPDGTAGLEEHGIYKDKNGIWRNY